MNIWYIQLTVCNTCWIYSSGAQILGALYHIFIFVTLPQDDVVCGVRALVFSTMALISITFTGLAFITDRRKKLNFIDCIDLKNVSCQVTLNRYRRSKMLLMFLDSFQIVQWSWKVLTKGPLITPIQKEKTTKSCIGTCRWRARWSLQTLYIGTKKNLPLPIKTKIFKRSMKSFLRAL